MRILQMSAYCEPEQISSTHLTNDLYEAIAETDIEIVDYVPSPCRGISKEVRNKYKKISFEEKYDGHYKIHRFPMFSEGENSIQRAVRYLLVNIIQYFKGSRAKGIDLIYAASTPPTQGLLCGLVKKRLKVPFVYNLQDVFPDSLVNAKMTKKGSIIWRIGRKIENYTYRNADKIIVISEDFKINIMEKGVPNDKIVVIPNWVNTDNVYSIDKRDNVLFDRYYLDRSKFYVCYSGNLGLSQNLELLIQVAEKARTVLPDVVFVLIGEGAVKVELESNVREKGLDNVVILPFQPYEDIAHVFSLGDAGLIISKPGIGGSSVPSKAFGIMAAGRPIIASFDLDSELCKMITQIGCGVVAKAGDMSDCINKIKEIYDNQSLNMGIKGRLYLNEHLNKEKQIIEYIKTLEMFQKNTI